MSKALITGGAGFIGSHLAFRLLEAGYAVDLADDFSRGMRDETVASMEAAGAVRTLTVDLTRPHALTDFDRDYRLVVHLAAIVGVANVLARPYAVLRDNVAMLANVIELAQRQSDLARFMFPSTSEVYAGTLQHFSLPVPTPESTPLAVTDLAQPRTSYMLSKIYGEAMTRHAEIPFTIFRPHNVYGPRMGLSHVIPELLQRAHETDDGGSLEVFSVDHRRTFCYVDDAIELLVRAVEEESCSGETLNLGAPGPEVSIGEVADLVVRTVGKRLAIAARPATPGSPLRRCPDMTRTMELTGFRPQVDLETGIERTYAWYRTHLFDRPRVTAG